MGGSSKGKGGITASPVDTSMMKDFDPNSVPTVNMGSYPDFQGQNFTRPTSEGEYYMFAKQNEMMDQGLAIAKEQEQRSRQLQQDYESIYRPIETGILPAGANRSNGFYSPKDFESLSTRDNGYTPTEKYSSGKGSSTPPTRENIDNTVNAQPAPMGRVTPPSITMPASDVNTALEQSQLSKEELDKIKAINTLQMGY